MACLQASGEVPPAIDVIAPSRRLTSGGAAENNFQVVNGVLNYGTAIKPGQKVEEVSMSRKTSFSTLCMYCSMPAPI